VRKFLDFYRHRLLVRRGEWESALELERKYLEEIIEGDSIQRIADAKVQIGFYILELDRFGYDPDLAEAEGLFQENINANLSLELSNTGLVMVYIHQGRLDEAYAHFSKFKSQFDQAINVRFENELIPWLKYEFALAEGNWHEAVEISESMLGLFLSAGYRYQSARQLINLGDALIGRNDPGDLEQARNTYQQSLEMFTEMGAPGYMRVLEERLAELGG
jgi:tetratricopeptide (TPR) repeat protein